ncbi:hypothetical protein MMC13_002256 [Lambiella insularis]|nr:hypothetical protein [Lambiella insularis]
MLVLLISVVLLLIRFGHTALDEVICHDNVLPRSTILTQIAFDPGHSPRDRSLVASSLSAGPFSAVSWLFTSPQPLEHPIAAAECFEAVSLIPEAPPLAGHSPGTHTRFNLEYVDSQRQGVMRYRLDANFVAGHCIVQILRRPSPNPDTDGLRHADAGAMALSVYPHAREKALAVIEQCLSGNRGQRRYRFGYVGTKSVLNGLDFDYVVAVTLLSGDLMAYPSEHFYTRDGEIQMLPMPGPAPFPFVGAFD